MSKPKQIKSNMQLAKEFLDKYQDELEERLEQLEGEVEEIREILDKLDDLNLEI